MHVADSCFVGSPIFKRTCTWWFDERVAAGALIVGVSAPPEGGASSASRLASGRVNAGSGSGSALNIVFVWPAANCLPDISADTIAQAERSII